MYMHILVVRLFIKRLIYYSIFIFNLIHKKIGRREGDPNFHPILPWVTDFSGSCIEDGWRDFTKTKFRINKGNDNSDYKVLYSL